MAYPIPKRLIAWMEKNNKTDVDLASVISSSQNTANRKLSGLSDFTLTELQDICKAWGLSADIFLPQ